MSCGPRNKDDSKRINVIFIVTSIELFDINSNLMRFTGVYRPGNALINNFDTTPCSYHGTSTFFPKIELWDMYVYYYQKQSQLIRTNPSPSDLKELCKKGNRAYDNFCNVAKGK